MGAARILIIGVAFLAAIGLAVVVRGMMVGKAPPATPASVAAAAPATPMVRVLVAKHDLTVGTRLSADDMTWQTWPQTGLSTAFITDGSAAAPAPAGAVEKAAAAAQNIVGGSGGMTSIIGYVVREPLVAGEPMVQRKLVPSGEGGYLAVVLSPGMRAVGVPVTVESGAGGFILPGDRVDVIQAREVEGAERVGGRRHMTEPIVVNVRVLAIDQKTTPEKDSQSLIGAVATLEVDPDAADALVEAIAVGRLQLALRSYADAGARSGRAQAKTASKPPTVRVFGGGQMEDVRVTQ